MPEREAIPPEGDTRPPNPGEHRIFAKLRAEKRLEAVFDGARGSPQHPEPKVPDHQLIRRIGGGAYGEVWLGKNVVGTYRAVKLVYRDSFHEEGPYEREFRGIQKFEPISRSNDGLIDILQIGRNDLEGWFYYVMELADHDESTPRGQTFHPASYVPATLQHVLRRRGRLSFIECLQFALPLTLALGHLHRNGLIHRDIKPSNIVFINGVPKLADIGLVAGVEEARSLVGTEGFIPPEGPNSPQADIYSLGKVLYEISMGKDRTEFPEPFTALGQAGSPNDLEELNALILKACATDPRDRYQTAEELHVDLALLQNGKSVKWRRLFEKRLARARKAAVVIVLGAALATGAYIYQRNQTAREEERAARMQIQHAENLLQRGQSALGMAHLANVLRRQPGNRIAAERTMSALLQRSFPVLSMAPLRHPNQLTAARFSPDGQQIVSSTTSGSLHFWSSPTGKGFSPRARHSGRVNSVEFSPDSLLVATAGSDGLVHILDAHTGAPRFQPLSHPGLVYAAIFDPTGRTFATACADSKVRVFSTAGGELVFPPFVQNGPVKSVGFSADAMRLASGAQDGSIQVWDARTTESWHQFRVDGPVELVRWSPDGKLLAAAFQDDPTGRWCVQVWDVASKREATHKLPHGHRIYSVHFSPDSSRLVTAATEAARVWNLNDGRYLFSVFHREAVYTAVFSPDGNRILTASVDQTARLWDATSGSPVSEQFLHTGRVIHAEFSPADDKILTASWDNTVKIWRVPATRHAPKTLPHQSWVKTAEFDGQGRQVISATGQTVYSASKVNTWNIGQAQTASIWNAETGERQEAISVPDGAEALIAQFTARGALALVCDRPITDQKALGAEQAFGNTAQVWDLETKTPIGGRLEFPSGIDCGTFSPDGHRLAVALKDRTVLIRDLDAKVTRSGRAKHRGAINSIHFDFAGATLVTASNDRFAVLWDAKTGEPRSHELVHESGVWLAQFNRAGDRVISVAGNFGYIWSTNGVCLAVIEDAGPIEYAEFNPDATTVVTACADGRARLWSAKTGRQLTDPLEHSSLVFSARFSPDGLRVLTASSDGTAQLWDGTTGLKLADAFSHGNRVVSARFNPKGTKALTASLDRTVKIWDIPVATAPVPAWLPELAESVTGQRLSADRSPEAIEWDRFANLKVRLKQLPDTCPYVNFARAFCADP